MEMETIDPTQFLMVLPDKDCGSLCVLTRIFCAAEKYLNYSKQGAYTFDLHA